MASNAENVSIWWRHHGFTFDSLAPGRCDFTTVISEHTLRIKFMSTSREIFTRWISQNSCDDDLTSVQVSAWCRQAASHYLSQCWPRYMSPYGTTGLQWTINHFLLFTHDASRWTPDFALGIIEDVISGNPLPHFTCLIINEHVCYYNHAIAPWYDSLPLTSWLLSKM